jgi:hypothetical protein
MRRYLLLLPLLALPAIPVAAGEHPRLERFVQRTPMPARPVEQTMATAGYPQQVSKHAIPSITRFDGPGYIGGSELCHPFARGEGAATGPTQTGTYGTDFIGFRQRPGRVFLAGADDPTLGYPFARKYRTDGPRITDVFALRPVRKAVLEAKEDKEERKHGGEGHPEGGHGSGGGEHGGH